MIFIGNFEDDLNLWTPVSNTTVCVCVCVCVSVCGYRAYIHVITYSCHMIMLLCLFAAS